MRFENDPAIPEDKITDSNINGPAPSSIIDERVINHPEIRAKWK